MDSILFYLLMIFVLALLVISYRKKKSAFISILVLIILTIIGGYSYLVNANFRLLIDSTFNTYDSHHVYNENQSYEVPLPPKTTLNFRDSDISAEYYTKLNIEEVVGFYEKESDILQQITELDDNKTLLEVLQEDDNYIIEVYVYEGDTFMYIDKKD